jgi:hypothetical protein
MSDTVQHIALTRALKTLDAIGARYAVQYDDQTYGTLPIAPEPKAKTRAGPRYARGMTRAHYGPHLQPMQPGDVATIPFGEFDPETLSANITAACFHSWGKGNTVTKRDDAQRVVNVLRIG